MRCIFNRKHLLIVSVVIMILLSDIGVFAASVYQYGDVNGDGVINLKDVTELRRLLSSGDMDQTDQNGNPDVNADGFINLKDVTVLQRYLAGGWGIELPKYEQPEEPEKPEKVPALSNDLIQYEVISSTKSEKDVICTAFQYGESVQGRDLVCWSIQQGEYTRTILLNFAIHGWEDSYASDGVILKQLGETLVSYYSESDNLQGCRLLIIPSANPDGLLAGTTNNGFGRCNAAGIDLNRDFDANHKVNTDARYYTPYPFSAIESSALRDLVLAAHPDIVIDFHGWQNFTLGSPDLAEVFSLYVGLNHKRELTASASGYFSYWAQLQGAEAMLVEFKDTNSVVPENVIQAIDKLVSNDYGRKQHDYQLDERYKSFDQIQCYASTGDKVYTQSAVGNTDTSYGYIDGANDVCTIQQIYTNGWCKVHYPVGSNGYQKTGYCSFSAFVDPETEVEHYTANVAETVKVYTTQSATTQLGSVWDTDTFTVIAEKGGMAQIIYPLDGGGYKMGWISERAILVR